MQDFTGVPAVVDLAAMRDAMADLGGDAVEDQPARPRRARHRPLGPGRRLRHPRRLRHQRRAASSSATRSATPSCAGARARSTTSRSCRRTPGIVHQVNLEYLARVVFTSDETAHEGALQAYPDTLVGTDSHTTMINGLGVLGWGVGGIEAEAAMLGQPMSMLIPQVLGFKLSRRAARGRDRDRPRADRHRDAARARRRRHVRRVLRPGRRGAAARRPRDDRQHVARSSARPARSSRSTPRRCATSSSPAARRSASSSSRPTPRSRASGTTRTPRSRPTPTRSSSTSPTSCPRSPARSARRTACR